MFMSEGIQISIPEETMKDGVSWLKRLLIGGAVFGSLGGNAAHIPFLDQLMNGISYDAQSVDALSVSYQDTIKAQQAQIEQLEKGCN